MKSIKGAYFTNFFMCFFFVVCLYSQNIQYKEYKGEVQDASSKKALVFATLALDGTNISTITNTEGEFLIKVPIELEAGILTVSFLGYESKKLPLNQLNESKNKIDLQVSALELSGVQLTGPKDAGELVRQTFAQRGKHYFDNPTLMTAFYRETIKKRKRNVSLSEAVVNVYKSSYNSDRRDAVEIFKARKSTDYKRLDTLALKLQGGPFNALFVDIMKYPEYIFSEDQLEYYTFTFKRSVRVNGRLIYIIDFKQHEGILDPLYRGELYIDAENKILTSALYTLNITDKDKAARLFVRRKPKSANVWPTEVAYRVDYREKNGKWYYGYSNVLLRFKFNWHKRLFNSVYNMNCEMAVTDWQQNENIKMPRYKDRLKSSVILADEAIGFGDPDFWGKYNIIEPEKSIESAIKKIKRQLRKTQGKEGAAAARPKP